MTVELTLDGKGQVLDGTGLYAPGFPLVVVQLPFKLNPKTGNLTGEEVYTGWAPSEDWFWSDPEEYFKTFTLQASKLHFDLGDFKVKVEENHDDDVDPMSTQIEAGQQQQLARVKTNRAHKTRTKPPVVAYRTPTQGSEARGVLLEDDCFRPRHQAHTGRLSQKPAEPVLPTEAPVPSGGTFDSKEALRNVAPDAWSKMDFKDKAYWNQKIKTEYGVMFPRIDISHLEISEKFPKRLNGEVKINPFNLEKAEVIRDTFDLGKLDWALVIITTEPDSSRKVRDLLRVGLIVARGKAESCKSFNILTLTARTSGDAESTANHLTSSHWHSAQWISNIQPSRSVFPSELKS
ncbi:hypothetical protein WJX79_009516 [Trebouxia sp. C0005]